MQKEEPFRGEEKFRASIHKKKDEAVKWYLYSESEIDVVRFFWKS